VVSSARAAADNDPVLITKTKERSKFQSNPCIYKIVYHI
jgi:hypothetical protein